MVEKKNAIKVALTSDGILIEKEGIQALSHALIAQLKMYKETVQFVSEKFEPNKSEKKAIDLNMDITDSIIKAFEAINKIIEENMGDEIKPYGNNNLTLN